MLPFLQQQQPRAVPVRARAAPVPAGACVPPRLRQQYRDDPTVACYAHCRNARQRRTTGGGAGAPLSTLSVSNFDRCMADCQTCETSRRLWQGSVDPDYIDWVIKNDEEYQDLRQEWEKSNRDCPYCEQRMSQILEHYYAPPPPRAPWWSVWRG